MKPIRVLIVDDQHLVREGIASLLALQPEIAVVGTAENGRAAIAATVGTTSETRPETRPDVILMDIRMPVMDGISAVEELTRRGDPARVLMLTTFDDEEYIVKSLRAGASGYLMKDLPIEDLTRAIVQVHNGTFQVAPGVMSSLLDRMQRGDRRGENDGAHGRRGATGDGHSGDTPSQHDDGFGDHDPEMTRIWERFTDRERDVLRLLGQGATNREIAETVHLSAGTVKNYVSEILTALDLRDRTQAALMAVKYGWDR